VLTHAELINLLLIFLNLYSYVSLSCVEGLFWRRPLLVLHGGVCDLPVSSDCAKDLQKKIYSLLVARLMKEQVFFAV